MKKIIIPVLATSSLLITAAMAQHNHPVINPTGEQVWITIGSDAIKKLKFNHQSMISLKTLPTSLSSNGQALTQPIGLKISGQT
jgi:hypothetical protein